MTHISCEWGLAGMQSLRASASLVIIIDVLSFSTAVDIAVSNGALVYPFPLKDHAAAQKEAERLDAILALPRKAAGEQFSLSPQSLKKASPGLKLILPSPNGSRLSHAGANGPILCGCLRNVSAIAATARKLVQTGSIAVIPAGERWPDGSLRPAIEDFLGAGAIINALGLPCSPEAEIAKIAYIGARSTLTDIVRQSVSGRELTEAGYAHDVDLALEYDVSTTAPLLQDGAYQPAHNTP